MHKTLNIQLVGYTDIAGKARKAVNEDSIYMSVDSSAAPDTAPEGTPMPSIGVIMAVADGISGLKHGEIASKTAIDTIADYIADNDFDEEFLMSAQRRRDTLEELIRKADKRIKDITGTDNPHAAMGSTLLVAWLYADTLAISWIGDSRAYVFNRESGLTLLTRDHSKVQEMVDSGEITYDEAFNHPGKHIITRLLGDPTQLARPESTIRKVGNNDTILLCTDGLTGLLRDRPGSDSDGVPYPEEDIETIMGRSGTITECMSQLWTSARRSGWHDNVTTILCRVIGNADTPAADAEALHDRGDNTGRDSRRWRKLWLALPVLLLALLGALLCVYFIDDKPKKPKETETVTVENCIDSIPRIEYTEGNREKNSNTGASGETSNETFQQQ